MASFTRRRLHVRLLSVSGIFKFINESTRLRLDNTSPNYLLCPRDLIQIRKHAKIHKKSLLQIKADVCDRAIVNKNIKTRKFPKSDKKCDRFANFMFKIVSELFSFLSPKTREFRFSFIFKFEVNTKNFPVNLSVESCERWGELRWTWNWRNWS